VLAALAHDVRLVLAGGREVRAPKSAGLMRDGAGKDWPRCSILIGPYRKGRREASLDRAARSFYGPGYVARQGAVSLPPRELSEWSEMGTVRRIFYVRVGAIRGGERFKHHLRTTRFFVFPVRTVLYRHGRFLRIELPSGCIVNRRGFVWP
jgi:hypothetical protein